MKKNTPLQSASDQRWVVFSHLQAAKESIGIKTRSLTVLRGLLSFISPEQWQAGQLQVFPSNRKLQERCDGMDERTLRRHLSHLCNAGVIQRKMSANRKRYAVRDENGKIAISYGFDLSGLKYHAERIEQLANDAKTLEIKMRARKAVLRDLIWKSGENHPDLIKLIRNKTSLEQLETAIKSFSKTPILTDTNGQNDRDIHNSKKEYIEETNEPTVHVTMEVCREKATDAIALSPTPIQDWADLHNLARTLSPAIGITPHSRNNARQHLGEQGATLAILGLVQSYTRIKNPMSYLSRLCQKALEGKINLERMFFSLTARSFRAETI